MRYVTTYTFKPFMTKEETGKLLAIFAEVGTAPGVTEHLLYADGSGGVMIGETDDVASMYSNVAAYGEYLEFQTGAVLSVEDAVPLAVQSIAE